MILQKKKKRGANCRNRSTQQGRGGARAKARKPPHRFRRPITSYSEPTELRPRFLTEGAAAVLQKMGLAVLYVSPLRVFERGEEMQ